MRISYTIIIAFFFNLCNMPVCSYAQSTFRAIEKMETSTKADVQPSAEDVLKRVKLEYKAENLRDPFQKYFVIPQPTFGEIPEESEEVSPEKSAEDEAAISAIKLQGLIWGGNIPQAIINESVVKAGDVVDNMQIIEINKDGVSVLFNNRVYNLSSPASVNLKDANKGLKGGQK